MLVGLPDHGLTTTPIDRPKLEVLPAIAEGHGDEHSEQDDLGPNPRVAFAEDCLDSAR